MPPDKYKPTLVLDPEWEKLIGDAAHLAGKKLQAFMRDAVIDEAKRILYGQPVEGVFTQLAGRNNSRWHERLELVLNDPEEAVGIQKNLEWAEKAVRSKPASGKRKSG